MGYFERRNLYSELLIDIGSVNEKVEKIRHDLETSTDLTDPAFYKRKRELEDRLEDWVRICESACLLEEEINNVDF